MCCYGRMKILSFLRSMEEKQDAVTFIVLLVIAIGFGKIFWDSDVRKNLYDLLSQQTIASQSQKSTQNTTSTPQQSTQYKEVIVIHSGAGQYCGTGLNDRQFQKLLSQGWRVTSKSVVQSRPKYNYPSTCITGYYSLER